MLWYLIFGLIFVCGVVLIILDAKGVGFALDLFGWLSAVCSIVVIIYSVFASVECTAYVSTYAERKAFYESQTVGSEYEDVAFKKEKAELNNRLFMAQWYKENMPLFSLYPDEVLDLEPIR